MEFRFTATIQKPPSEVFAFFRDIDQVRDQWREKRLWCPAMDETTREALYAGWKRAVERSMGWLE